jgi:Na+(H+)/acetate symporter ActP
MIARATLAVALAVGAGLMLTAGTAHAEESAQDVINDLQREGYTVTIDKSGTAPLSQCVVLSVRNPQTITQWVPYVGPGLGKVDGGFLVPVITSRTISVSLDCSRR